MHTTTLLLTALSLLAPTLASYDNCRGGFGTASNPDDTCESFARRWRITVDELKRLNPEVTCPDLAYINDTYCVSEGTNTASYAKKTTDLSDDSTELPAFTTTIVTTSKETASSTAPGQASSQATSASSSAGAGAGAGASGGASASPSATPTGSSGASALKAGSYGLFGGALGVFALL